MEDVVNETINIKKIYYYADTNRWWMIKDKN